MDKIDLVILGSLLLALVLATIRVIDILAKDTRDPNEKYPDEIFDEKYPEDDCPIM